MTSETIELKIGKRGEIYTTREMIGITTAIVENSQGVSFAIPSDTILRELPYLIGGEQYLIPG